MKYVVLDTNFILSCVRKKIDFFHEIKFSGLKIIIPIQVINELENLSETGNLKLRDEAKVSLTLLKKNPFEKTDLKIKNVDNGIVKLAKEHEDYVIATLDKGIQSKIKNQKLIIRGEKELEVR
ncbi:MAG: PIN domain-containing protein [Candidatus Pacearchaeota archaeon]|jgi:rRNA-processing protein FCF1